MALLEITIRIIALVIIAVIYALLDAFALFPALLEIYEIVQDAIAEIRKEKDH